MENTLENAMAFIRSRPHYNKAIADKVIVNQAAKDLFDYASSVRPVVVLPIIKGNPIFNTERVRIYIDKIKRLNPDMTFTSPIPHGLEPELPDPCPKCGGKMLIVRPGSWQCEKCGY